MAAPDHDRTSGGPESPTTVQPFEMSDDDDVQESGIISMDDSTTKPSKPSTGTNPLAATVTDEPDTNRSISTSEEAPPPKPPRPVSEQQKNVMILKEAFPSIDESVIKAVLRASGGQIDPAFNALLEMTDPDAVQHDAAEVPPPQPPRPQGGPQSQLEADELYARQLAQQFENDGAYEGRTANRGAGGPGHAQRRQQTGLKPNELYDDREHSFIDDDLPVIQEKLKQGFIETQTKVNSWFTDIKKKFDEQFDEDGNEHQQQQQGPRGPFRGRDSAESSRRSRDYERYDADPELLSDDFAGMKFHSDGTPARRAQNPNLFKPPPSSVTSPKPGDGRKVAFKDGSEEIDPYGASPKFPPKDVSGSAAKTSKWQPLSTVEPSPIAENDPFSLGDSDDDKDATKDKSGDKGVKSEESEETQERLRKAAAEAMSDSLVDDKAKADAAVNK